jgi:hypothetical protein
MLGKCTEPHPSPLFYFFVYVGFVVVLFCLEVLGGF